MFIIIFWMISIWITVVANEKCWNDAPQTPPEYHLIAKCQRSKLKIAAKANYSTLSTCKRFGMERRALSLNFSPPKANGRNGESLDYTCEVLQCAETIDRLSLTDDSRYDYYSLFGYPLPTDNSTCVPSTGMFYLITQRLNYTAAESVCRNMSSVLAHVTTDRRTNALAQLLSDESTDSAYVGLKRSNSSDFVAENGDALECTSYRAWSPGHPRRRGNAHCMVITRYRTWRSVDCDQRLPALCELKPGKPYKKKLNKSILPSFL